MIRIIVSNLISKNWPLTLRNVAAQKTCNTIRQSESPIKDVLSNLQIELITSKFL